MRNLPVCILVPALLACSDTSGPDPTDDLLDAVLVASGLDRPVHLAAPPDDPRLFIVEQEGRIRIIRNGGLLDAPFLDIVPQVSSGGERGLLSMAFDPDYSASGHFWVNYTDRTGATRVERYRVSSNPDVADAGSSALVIRIEQPHSNHNGGQIAFGPDGMLYIGMGDGGGAGDPHGHAQNAATLLGALLRLDVRSAVPYAIPPDNPFVADPSVRPEIWATGLRNPWRFSFDRDADVLYVADVGQDTWEEINAVPRSAPALNYGWNIMEGAHCYAAAVCGAAGLTLPVHEYDHGDGCSVTGGHVYRGQRMPALAGTYFYSDFCGGWLRSLRLNGSIAGEHRDWAVGALGGVLSFGEDAAGELYVLTAAGGVYRLEPR